MKTSKNFFLFLSVVLWMLASCNNAPQKPKDSEKMADKANEAKTETNRSEEDAQVLVNAVSSDLFEIAAAEQASTMATNAQVKEFASHMIQEHNAMVGETRSLAARKGFTVPSVMSNDYMDDINDMKSWKRGKEFDTKYMKGQVDQHQKILDDIEKRMASTADSDVKAWAEKAAAAVRKHLQMANSINTQLEVAYK